MPLGMQAKILRALQERKVRPLGSSQEASFDARILAATNRDLEAEVEEKRFREDLFYRINVVRVDVPPLRSRGNDVLLLAQHFLERAAERSGKSVTRLGRLVAERLIGYDWPGNVRELENCMERAVALARFDEITARRSAAEDPRAARDRGLHRRATIRTSCPRSIRSRSGISARCSRPSAGTRPWPRRCSASTAAPCTASSSAISEQPGR